MAKNRVEKLETTVTELESTVRGLTEELVETKERVRILEAELDADPRARHESDGQSESASAEELLTAEPGDARTEAEQHDVEQAAAKARSEGAKQPEGEPEDESEESEHSDDIIVA